MFILLIFLSFVMLSVWARRAILGSWRESFILAIAVCGVWVLVTTEVLSFLHFISFVGILSMWGILGLSTGLMLWCEQKPFPTIRISWDSLSLIEKVIIGFLVVIVTATAVNALNSPPNTWDALTYHMSRVVHWIQNRSVEFYPTHIPRQLFSNPWLEYTILQFQILSGGDYWASMVQWFCMIASLVAVSLIAREFGLSGRSQWLAVLIAATVPMGIIQSTSVQGDYAAALWLSFSFFAFLAYQRSRLKVWVLTCGVSLGLACLSKGTAIVYAFPIIFWIFLDTFQQFVWRKFILLILMLLMVLSINGLFIERNMELFHQKMLGPVQEEGVSLINERKDYQTFAANLIRNIGIHLGTPSEKINRSIEKSIESLAKNLNVNLKDTQASFLGCEFHINKPSRDENTAAAPFHLGLFALVSLLLFIYQRNHKKICLYLSCVLAMIVLFCLIVKWQPWIIRFQLPVFILFAPLAAVVIEWFSGYWKKVTIMILLFVIALPYVFNASPRHLIGPKSLFHQEKIERYFLGNSSLSAPYAQGAKEILKGGCKEVGLIMGGDSWEYPFWVLIARDHSWNGRIEHVKVDNMTSHMKYPLGAFDPCQVVVFGNNNMDNIQLGLTRYIMTNTFGSNSDKISIFSRELKIK